jgi:hypothetical protein
LELADVDTELVGVAVDTALALSDEDTTVDDDNLVNNNVFLGCDLVIMGFQTRKNGC